MPEMANRLVRDGFVDSESVCSLSDWAHRVYSNLLVRTDDAGRADGRAESLRSLLFPLGSPRRAEDISKAMSELESPTEVESGRRLPALVILYHYAGKPFVQLTKVAHSTPATRSKFPWRDGSYAIEYVTMETRDGRKSFVSTSLTEPIGKGSDPLCSSSSPSSSSSPEIPRADARARNADSEDHIPEPLKTPEFLEVWKRWKEHRRQIRKPLSRSMIEMQLKKLASYGPSGAVESIEQSLCNGWQGLFEPKGNAASGKNGKHLSKHEQNIADIEKFLETQ